MNDHPGLDIVRRFFTGTGATYDRIATLCTFGFDGFWKRRMVQKIPAGAKRILDQACGTGILTLKIARKFPHAQITGVDVTDEYLKIAQEKARRLGLKNVEFILGRAEDVLLPPGLDCITSSYLAKYADLGILIPNLKTMLREGGVLIMHDFTYPANGRLAPFWEFYFKLLQTVGAWIFPPWRAAFDGLPGLLRKTTWVSELVGALKGNGFTNITVQSFTFGTAAIITATKDEKPA